MPRTTPRPLVGRVAELTRLLQLLADATAGNPGVALVSGDAGVGKSRLLAEAMTRARETGATVLLGSCVQVGDFGLPYVALVDALRGLESDPLGAKVLRAEAARRPALGRVVPHLVEQGVDDGGGESALAEGLAQVQLFEAVHDVLLELAAHAPVLFVIEDAHWADRSTRDLIAFLAQTTRVGRVALVVSYRSDDVHRRHPLRPLLAELTRRPDVERVDLGPLSRAELAELLQPPGQPGTTDWRTVDPQLLEQIFTRSEGNAFFAEELMRAACSSEHALPEALNDVLLTRVEVLDEQARRVLRLAAVAGRRAPHDLLVEAAAVSAEATEGALRRAVEAGLLATDGETYAFRHALLQEAVYGDLLPGERVRLHARFAQLLADNLRAGFGAAVRTAELAHHRLASHDLDGAFAALVAAATEAEAVAAPAEALQHLEQALELVDRGVCAVDRVGLLTRAAQAAADSGDPTRAVRHATSAVEAADAAGDPLVRAETREMLARLRIENSQPAADTAAQAVDLLGGQPASALHARALATYARSLGHVDPAAADRLLSEASAMADAVDAPAIAADALITRALMLRWGVIPGRPEALLDDAVRRAESAPDGLASLLRALRFHSTHLLDLGEVERALTVASRGVALSEQAGLIWSSYGLDLRLLRGWALAARGDWDDVLEASRDAVYAPTSPGRVLATQALAVLVARGDPGVDTLLERLRATDDKFAHLQLDLIEADLLAQRNRPAEALAVIERSLARHQRPGETEPVLLAMRGASICADLALLARSSADDAGALAHAAEADRYATLAEQHEAMRPRRPAVVAWSTWARAEADRAAGAATPATWAAVIAATEQAGNVERAALARFRFAECALDRGERGPDTVAALRGCLHAAHRLGAVPLATRAGELARHARLDAEVGVEARPASASASAMPAPLTARETEVLALLAEGRTNRQIGQALFISEKTASVHVSNVIRKVEAGSRTEAVAMARRLGLLSA